MRYFPSKRKRRVHRTSGKAIKKTVLIPTKAQVIAEREKLKLRKEYKKALRGTIYILLVVAALAVLAVTLFLPVLEISGTSMEPTLEDGDIIVLVKSGQYERGDLCGFAYENKYLIKRIIGVPGDYIDIDEAGTVYVNGKALDEPYVTQKSLGYSDVEFPLQVPDNRYFIMGDHRSTSVDSRSLAIGCVDKDQIIGTVLIKIWPLNKISTIH